MPHAYILEALKDPKAVLTRLVASRVGQIKAMAITYAYAKLDEIVQKLLNQCPPARELEQIAKTLNTLKKLLDKYKKQTDKFRKLAKTLNVPIKTSQVIVEVLSHIPIPAAFTPMGIIQTAADTIGDAKVVIKRLKDNQKAIQAILDEVESLMAPILSRIESIEALLQRCMESQTDGGTLTEEERRRILTNLTGNLKGLTPTDDLGESYIGENGKEYIISVITDPNSPPVAPRRQAIAKDFRGIVVIKGPLSFAGDNQILKDELKFRIDNQLP